MFYTLNFIFRLKMCATEITSYVLFVFDKFKPVSTVTEIHINAKLC